MPSPEWRPCEHRVDYWADNQLARCKRLRFLFSEGADNVPQVSPETCASCPIPAQDELIAKLVAVAEETKRLCDEETQKSVPSAIRPAWCSPMTKRGKTLACLAEDALEAHAEAVKEAAS